MATATLIDAVLVMTLSGARQACQEARCSESVFSPMPGSDDRIMLSPRAPTAGAVLDGFGGVGPGFDALRLGAAVAVLVSHAFDFVGQSPSEPFRVFAGTNISLGGTATYVFFLISGFLVTASLMRTRSVGEFALKRAARILPGLIGVVCVTALLIGPALTIRPLAEYFSDPRFTSYFLNAVLITKPSLPGVLGDTTINGSIWTLL